MSTKQTPKLCGLATASRTLGASGVLLGLIVMGLLVVIPVVMVVGDDRVSPGLMKALVGAAFLFFVAGMLCSVSAVVVGRKARTAIQQSSGSLAGGARAFGGLTMGYAGLGLGFVIFSVMLPLLLSVTDAPLCGKTTGTLRNGKQIFMAMLSRTLDSSVPGGECYWPQSSAYSTSTAVFTNLVGRGMLKTDYSFFTSPGLTGYRGTNAALFTAENNAWCVVADLKDSDADQMPLLFTRNLKINSLAEFKGVEQLSDDPPFGRSCVLVIFKGGAAQKFTPEMLASNFNICHATNRVLRP